MVMWNREEIVGLERENSTDLNLLFQKWPKEVNYIHPIKLSKWNL